jgi:tetratricopeptide (TPR) repeat protein
MRTTLRIVAIALAVGLAGCVDTSDYTTVVPDAEVASQRMTLEDARATLKNVAGYLCVNCSPTQVPRPITGIDVTDDQVLVFIQANGDRSQTIPVSALSVHERLLEDHGKVFFTPDSSVCLLDISADLASKIADALVVIKLAPALKERQIAFEAQAKAYRDATVKPTPGEDVRRFRVQADQAVSEKRFQTAASLYIQALDLAPWWPEGQFNAAVIFGDLRQYDQAIGHMRKYLTLVPNAPDARAAQDKIYAWEGEKAALPQPLKPAADSTRGSFGFRG